MCGIAGIVRWQGARPAPDEIERMTAALAHRGPDGAGTLLRGPIALGHRRLSIIDLATGCQPMGNEDGQVQITFNGEIYNYRELTQILRERGHTFRTTSDTEVILHAYEEWGDACVERLRGMFAFGLVDFPRRRLLLARDPVGIKPLYYRRGTDYFAFGSELSALRAVDAPPPHGRLDAVEMFLRFQYIPAPATIFEDVWKLPPGHRLAVSFDGQVSAPVRYWEPDFSPTRGVSEAEWLERFDAALAETVTAQLVADVPFGVLLSGGIDSTLVALALSRQHGPGLQGFTIGFEEEEFSELPYAREVAEACGFELVHETVRDDFWESLPELVQHYGEPFGDSSAIPTWAVARLARRHVPMVFSGDGGDEAFGGYRSYQYWCRPDLRPYLRRLRYTRTRAALATLLWAGVRRWVNRGVGDGREWERLQYWCGESLRQSLWRPDWRFLVQVPSVGFHSAHARAPRHDALAYAQQLDFQTYLPQCILTKVDVASMFHGLEVRPPLLDRQIVELAATLPAKLRLRSAPTGPVGKYLLKQTLWREFPTEFVHRRKQGFCIPQARWLRPGTRGAEVLRALLLGTDSPLHTWFEPAVLRDLYGQHAAGRNKSAPLWLLLILGLWLQQNPDIRFSRAPAAPRSNARVHRVRANPQPQTTSP
ncbi:MAG: asparagine synthase (glutamine-hydrolyzing) [Phycisphaerales bacterium]|nr:asparagine synthase (glutamine-hydrolyzing) [Phycisphaerales bacterium]